MSAPVDRKALSPLFHEQARATPMAGRFLEIKIGAFGHQNIVFPSREDPLHFPAYMEVPKSRTFEILRFRDFTSSSS